MKRIYSLLSLHLFFFVFAFSQPVIEWSHVYGGSDREVLYDIIETNDNNCITVGYSKSSDQDVSKNNGAKDF